jgi:hypothetical protein
MEQPQVLHKTTKKIQDKFSLPSLMQYFAALKQTEFIELRTLRNPETKEVYVEIRAIKKAEVTHT